MKRFAVGAGLVLASHAWASHPLITEDTGVLDKGGWQLELHGERSRDQDTRTTDGSAVLAYGFAQSAEVQLEEGGGDASLSVKWRFHEKDKLSLVLKPELHEGRRWGASFVAGYEAGRFELLGHLGYLRNRNGIGERESLWHASAAVLFAATEQLKLVLDLGRDSNPDPASRTSLREIVYGLMYGMTPDVDLGLGLKRGLSDPADDRALLAGLKFRW